MNHASNLVVAHPMLCVLYLSKSSAQLLPPYLNPDLFPLIIHIPLEALVEFWTCSFRNLNRMLYQKEMNIQRNDR